MSRPVSATAPVIRRQPGRSMVERLLDDDVGPRGERPRHQLGVRVVGRRHDDDVDGLLGDHLLEAVGRVLRQPGGPAEGLRDDALVVVHPARVGVEQRDEGGDVGVLPDDRADVHARPVARPGDRVPQVLALRARARTPG